MEGRVENSAERGMAGFELGEAAVKKGRKGAGKDSETALYTFWEQRKKPEDAGRRADDSGVRRLFGL